MIRKNPLGLLPSHYLLTIKNQCQKENLQNIYIYIFLLT